MSSSGMARLTLALVSHLVQITILLAVVTSALPPPGIGWKPSRGSNNKDQGKPLRGSQVYLQDPWIHEHNYFGKQNHGPKHGWGWGGAGGSSSHGSASNDPDKATYVQQLYPVLHIGNTLKRLSSTLQALKPSKWGWGSPAFAFFGTDGSPHHVGLNNGHGADAHGGTYETDGWSHNHASHHIGHTVPKKPSYSTW